MNIVLPLHLSSPLFKSKVPRKLDRQTVQLPGQIFNAQKPLLRNPRLVDLLQLQLKKLLSTSVAEFFTSFSRCSPGNVGVEEGVDMQQQCIMFKKQRIDSRPSGRAKPCCRDVATCGYKHIPTLPVGAAYIPVVSILTNLYCLESVAAPQTVTLSLPKGINSTLARRMSSLCLTKSSPALLRDSRSMPKIQLVDAAQLNGGDTYPSKIVLAQLT